MMGDTAAPLARLRNARACEACRSSKSRCIYKHENNRCQRCAQNGSQCIVREKARPMRHRATRSSTSCSSAKETNYILDLPAVPSRDITQEIEELKNHHDHDFGVEGDPTIDRPSAQHAAQKIIKSRKITLEQAEKLLVDFKKLLPFFPFVRIPQNATVPSLSRYSPFLLLSILTTAAKPDADLYHQMDHEFRRVLSQKLVIEGKKSLDFLEGLLVYIAWSCIPSSSKTNQLFVYLNLAISLTSDLGLDTEFPSPHRFVPIDTKGLIADGVFTKAAKRAYLGCYFLSSSVSLGFQKPNGIQYGNLMELRCMELSLDDPSCEIHYIIRLIRLWERVTESYSADGHAQGSEHSSLSTDITLHVFLNELQEYKRSAAATVRNKGFVGIQERFTHIMIYGFYLRLGFLRGHYNQTPLFQCRPQNVAYDFQCLEVCKTFFEYLLSMPEESFLLFTHAQWDFTAQSFVILSRLTFAMAADLRWDSDSARKNIPMVMYLDCLCWRFQKLSSTPENWSESGRSPDQLYIIRKILETLKKLYSRRVAAIQSPPSVEANVEPRSTPRAFCPMKDADLNAFFNSSVSQSSDSLGQTESSGASTFPLYHDIWSTMTGSWASEEL